MAERMSLEAIVKVIAYGVPALLIVLGFFAYVSGYAMSAITHDSGMMNGGILLDSCGSRPIRHRIACNSCFGLLRLKVKHKRKTHSDSPFFVF